MSKKIWITLIIMIVALSGLIYAKEQSKSNTPLIGVKHPDQGQQHIQRDAKHAAYNSSPASSGPHYNDSQAPAQWGVYTTAVPDEVFLHNEEHGGIVITYQPDTLPADQLQKLQTLFAPPYSNKSFAPVKAIVTPRASNTQPIELAAWQYTLSLDYFDEATIIKFYEQHAGKAPEALAGPTNTPINQAITR